MQQIIRVVQKGERIGIILNPESGRDRGYCPTSVAPETGLLIEANDVNMDSVFIGRDELRKLGFIYRPPKKFDK